MYDFPEMAEPHDRLWSAVVVLARSAGVVGDVPLIQVCGYPLQRSLRGRYDVVAAPRYALPFCEGATHRALVVVASDTPYSRLEDLRGARFAVNGLDSNTGMNLPRRLIAPIADGRRFFRTVTVTGSHAASLDAVAIGEADAASIDSVTFALLTEHRPEATARVRVLTSTASSRTPPFVTARDTEPRARALLYAVLAAAIADAARADVRRALHLTGIEPATLQTYEPLGRYEEEAAALGYPVLA